MAYKKYPDVPIKKPKPKPKPKGSTIGEKYRERRFGGGGGGVGTPRREKTQEAIKEEVAERATGYTQKQLIQKSLLERQGYDISRSERGELIATRDGQQVVIDVTGQKVVTAPGEAKVQLTATPTFTQQQRTQAREKARRSQTYFIGAVPERGAKRKTYEELDVEEKRGLLTPTLSAAASAMERVQERRYEIARDIRERRGFIGESMEFVGEKYRKFDIFAKEKTEKYMPDISKGFDILETKRFPTMERALTLPFMQPFLETKATRKHAVKISRGAYLEIKEHPTRAALTTAAIFVAPPVLKLVGKGVSLLPYGRAAIEIIEPTAAGIIAGFYAKGITERVKKAPDKSIEIGRVLSGQIAPLAIGGYAGAKVWPKVEGLFRTIGRKYVDPSKIIEPKVLKGEALFPTAKPSKHLKLFKESEFKLPVERYTGTRYTRGKWKLIPAAQAPVRALSVWHAGAGPAKLTAFSQIVHRGKGTVPFLTSEYLPGGFVSPSLSPYFLKIKGGYAQPIGVKVFTPYGTPTAMFIYPKGIRTRGIKKIPRIGKLQYLFKGKDIRGVADVPKRKAEIEALIPPKTRMKRIQRKFYTKFEGVRVPIDEFKAFGIGKITAVKGKPMGTLKGLYSFEKPASYSITPSSLLGSMAVSVFGSRVSRSDKVSSIISKSYRPSGYYPQAKGRRYDISRGIYGGYEPRIYTEYKPTPRKTYGAYRTYTPGRYDIRGYRTYTPPPPPPPGLMLGGRRRVVKKKKKKGIRRRLKGEYKPTIRAVYQRIGGDLPKLLTGLEVRPLLSSRGRRRKRKR